MSSPPIKGGTSFMVTTKKAAAARIVTPRQRKALRSRARYSRAKAPTPRSVTPKIRSIGLRCSCGRASNREAISGMTANATTSEAASVEEIIMFRGRMTCCV